MWRRYIYWILTIAFAYFVITRITEIRTLAETIIHGAWWWVAAATLLELLVCLGITYLYHKTFQTISVKSNFYALIPVFFASIFVNVAAPIGGGGGVALFADNAKQHGQSAARAAAGALLAPITQFLTFALILAIGLLLLKSQGHLYTYELVASAILLLFILVMSSIIYIGLKHPRRLYKILNWLQKTGNNVAKIFNKKTKYDREWVMEHVEDFNEATEAFASKPKAILLIFLIALSIHILSILILATLFLAFQAPLSLNTLFISYAIVTLFWVVSITPQGVGVVEAIMPIILISLGVDASKAAVITLSYRGLNFWIPLLVGAITVRRIKSFQTDGHD